MAGIRAASALLRAVSNVIERNWGRPAGLLPRHRFIVGLPPGVGNRMEALEERRLLSVTVDASGSSGINEGSHYSLYLTATTSATVDLTGWSIDWGDGSSPTALDPVATTSADHVYADGPNDFTITATGLGYDNSLESADSGFGTVTLHVDNVDPDTTVDHDNSADEGGLFSAVFEVNSNIGADTLTNWTIDWGDGGSDTYAGDPSAGGGQTMYHVFADGPATFHATSTVEDDDGVYTNAMWDVNVFNVSASFAISAPTTKEGESFTLDIGYSDPGDDSVTSFHIDWGDGQTDTLPGDAWEAEHMYTDGPTSNVVTAIAYAEDANHTVSTTVTVENVAPDWQIKDPPAHTPLNHPVTIHWSDYVDAGADSRTGWTVDWGDGSSNSVSGSTNDMTHLYEDAGAYVATLIAADGDGTYEKQVNFNIDDSDAYNASYSLGSNPQLSFQLQTGMLVANYDDDNGDQVPDDEETDSVSSEDDDLYRMRLYIPPNYTSSDSVTLTSTEGFFNIYDSATKANLLSDDGTLIWSNATTVPHVLYIEVKEGSEETDEIQTVLSSSHAGSTPCEQDEGSVSIEILSYSDPNGDTTGDGAIITDTTRTWLVGQFITETVVVEGPADWTDSLLYQWQVPGSVLEDYVRATGTIYPVVNNDPITGTGYQDEAIGFFWESTTAGQSGHDSNQVRAWVSLDNGAILSAASTYNVYTPAWTMSAVQGTAKLALTNLGSAIGLFNTAGHNQGMDFAGSVTTTDGFEYGEWNFVQLVNNRRVAYAAPLDRYTFGAFNTWGLDTSAYPPTFQDTFETDNSWYADGAEHYDGDDPLSVLTARFFYKQIKDTFKTIVMFKPPGAESRWVPLNSLQWDFQITARDPGAGWALLPGAPVTQSMTPANGVSVREVAEPTWTITHSSSETWHTP